MIHRRTDTGWTETEIDRYKDEPGTWMAVTRQLLMPEAGPGFQVRYFEIAPSGYTSLEHHLHEHCVIVLKGAGEVFLDGEWQPLKEQDLVHVPPHVPHQFRNPHATEFGILCVVDRNRDKPTLLIEE